jgi:hypothetical protein
MYTRNVEVLSFTSSFAVGLFCYQNITLSLKLFGLGEINRVAVRNGLSTATHRDPRHQLSVLLACVFFQ